MDECPCCKEKPIECPHCGKEGKIYGENAVGCSDTVNCGAIVDFGHWCGEENGIPAVHWVILQWNTRVNQWTKVEDGLPEEYWREKFKAETDIDRLMGTFVVYFDDKEDPKVSFASYTIEDGWCYPNGVPHDFWKDKITHWQPLPQSPKKVEENQPLSIIRTERFIDISELPDAANKAYREFVQGCGLSNGERWCWEVGEHGDDSVAESYIGIEKQEAINKALRDAGLKDGEIIHLVFDW